MASSDAFPVTLPDLFNITGNSTAPVAVQVAQIIKWMTFFVGLPAIGLAIYTLKNLSKGSTSV